MTAEQKQFFPFQQVFICALMIISCDIEWTSSAQEVFKRRYFQENLTKKSTAEGCTSVFQFILSNSHTNIAVAVRCIEQEIEDPSLNESTAETNIHRKINSTLDTNIAASMRDDQAKPVRISYKQREFNLESQNGTFKI